MRQFIIKYRIQMKRHIICLVSLIVITIIVIKYIDYSHFIESYINPLQNKKQIEISPNYKDRIKVDLYVKGLSFPTSMIFVDNNSLLVTEKNQGNVRLISKGILQKDPIFTINNISNEKEQGLLGITLSNKYAYGIRNSFGLAIDPLTGKLQDTENGEDNYDEINLVQSGFNSGWSKIIGPISRNNNTSVSDLIVFNGSHYSDPELSWRQPVGVTDIEFLESSLLGKDLENNIFVGDINNGNLYFLKIDSNRSAIDLNHNVLDKRGGKGLQDLVVDDKNELEQVIFAKGFEGRITDIETGLDGNLYKLTYFDGSIYRITHTEK